MKSLLLTGTASKPLIFKAVDTSDFEAWLPFYSDPDSTRYWTGIPTDPVLACREQFDRIFDRIEKGLGGMNALIEKTSGGLVGLCELLVQEVNERKELEIGYSVLPDFRKKGFATEAACHCREYAFDNALSSSLISIIHTDNIPSMKVALNVGMTKDFSTTYKNNPVHIYRINA